MEVQILAAVLIIGRIITMGFILAVIRKQWRIRHSPIHPRLKNLRKALTLLAVLVFAGSIYPLLLDTAALLCPSIVLANDVDMFGAVYALDNNATFMLSAILIWTLYRLSDVVIEAAELVTGKIIDTGTHQKK